MNFYSLGINHRTAPLEVRERLWFSEQETRDALSDLKADRFPECVLVSTCNRTELYYRKPDGSSNGEPLWRTLAGYKGALGSVNEANFYSIESLHAVKHLFNVASGIDSMILGEFQILSQIREAYALAAGVSSTGSVMNRIFDTALRIGKRARTETEIGTGAVSVSYAAAELSSKIFDDLSKRTALLIGAGETGRLTAKHLAGKNIGTLLVANRTRERAEALSAGLGGTVIEFDRILPELERADIVISSVESPGFILKAEDLRRAAKLRGNRALFIIDLGVPRNIDPEANSIESVFLHDVDALNHIVDKNLVHRKAEVPRVRTIILEELVRFQRWYASLEVNPTIEQLREHAETIRRSEVEKHLNRFSPGEREELDHLTKRIISKILHAPTVNLKTGHENGDGATLRDKIHLVRHLFGLDKGDSR